MFGSSGGVGQWICNQLVLDGMKVRAISRNIEGLSSFPLLKDCEIFQADARVLETLGSAVAGADHVVISVRILLLQAFCLIDLLLPGRHNSISNQKMGRRKQSQSSMF